MTVMVRLRRLGDFSYQLSMSLPATILPNVTRQLTRGFGVWSIRAGLSRKKGLAGISG